MKILFFRKLTIPHILIIFNIIIIPIISIFIIKKIIYISNNKNIMDRSKLIKKYIEYLELGTEEKKISSKICRQFPMAYSEFLEQSITIQKAEHKGLVLKKKIFRDLLLVEIKIKRVESLKGVLMKLLVNHHKNIAPYYHFYINANEYNICQRYIFGKKLSKYKEDEKINIEYIIKGTFSAIKHLHTLNIVHTKISPRSILISGIEPIILNLTDCISLDDPNTKIFNEDKIDYFIAPELYKNNLVDKTNDWWSFGVLCYYLLEKKIYVYDEPLEFKIIKDEDMKNFISSLLNPEYDSRKTYIENLNCDIINKYFC